MKKLTLLLGVFLILASSVIAQVTLDPNQYVNVQIAADTLANGTHDPAKTVYKAESGQFYAFDGFLNCDFDLVIEGPDNTWIKNQNRKLHSERFWDHSQNVCLALGKKYSQNGFDRPTIFSHKRDCDS